MPIRMLAVALVAAAALALEAAFLQALVVAPLSSALRHLHGPPAMARLEKPAPLVAQGPAPRPAPPAEGPRPGLRRAGGAGR